MKGKRHYVIWSGEGTGPAQHRVLVEMTDIGIKRRLTRERQGGDRWAMAFYKDIWGTDDVGIDVETGQAKGMVFINEFRYWER